MLHLRFSFLLLAFTRRVVVDVLILPHPRTSFRLFRISTILYSALILIPNGFEPRIRWNVQRKDATSLELRRDDEICSLSPCRSPARLSFRAKEKDRKKLNPISIVLTSQQTDLNPPVPSRPFLHLPLSLSPPLPSPPSLPPVFQSEKIHELRRPSSKR